MTAVDLEARRRALTLAKGTTMPFRRPVNASLIASALAGIVTLVVYLGARQPLLAVALGAALGILVAVAGWRPMANRDFRAAAELVFDHTCHELAEWKRATGTSMPRTRAAQMGWLEEHPTNRGRASLLLALGRLVEADAAIDAIRPQNSAEQFDVGLLRATRVLYAEGTVDTAPIHELWRALPPGHERRHRRECTAVLDAMVAIADGRDAMPGLAKARSELETVHWTMRIKWIAAKWIAIGLGSVLVGLLAGLVLAG